MISNINGLSPPKIVASTSEPQKRSKKAEVQILLKVVQQALNKENYKLADSKLRQIQEIDPQNEELGGLISNLIMKVGIKNFMSEKYV